MRDCDNYYPGRDNVSVGAANQTIIPPFVHNLPSSIAPGGAVNSNLIKASGYTKIAAGVTSSQNGSLTIQRYLDDKGLVLSGVPQTIVLTAGVPASLTVNDGLMFGSFLVSIANSNNGATALLSNLAVVVASDPVTPAGVLTSTYQTATSTTVSVLATGAATILFMPNPNARFRSIRAPRSNIKPVWVTMGPGAASGSGWDDMVPGDYYEMSPKLDNFYQGLITAYADTADNTPQIILVTEGV